MDLRALVQTTWGTSPDRLAEFGARLKLNHLGVEPALSTRAPEDDVTQNGSNTKSALLRFAFAENAKMLTLTAYLGN